MTETTSIPAERSLAIDKVVDQATFDAVGTELEYTVTVTNSGNVTLSGLDVVDAAPGSGLFDASDCEGLATTLAPGVSLDCTVTYVTTQADLDVGGVTNTATATATAPGDVAVGPAIASATSSAIKSPQLSIDKVVDQPAFTAVDSILEYTITVANPGTSP